jgi:hypothetical protein
VVAKRGAQNVSDIPEELKRMVRGFNEGAMPEPLNEKRWIENVLSQTDGKAKVVIRRYLDELLKRKPEGRELQRVWQTGHPAYVMSDEHLRLLLTMINKALQPN